MAALDEYRSLLDGLPLDSVVYAFAYGSGAISQQGANTADKMVDFIVVTSDSDAFHAANLAANPSHYSSVRWVASAEKLALLQRQFGARVFYNTNIRANTGRLIKYGVIDVADLKEDCLDWRWIYVAGRLHKPVLDVIPPPDNVRTHLEVNRKSALQAALLLMPSTFSFEELYTGIVALSYNGDFRMQFGEDKKKVSKIVDGAYDLFDAIYRPALAEDPRVVVSGSKVEHDTGTSTILHRLNLLPGAVAEGLDERFRRWDRRQRDVEEMLFAMAHRHDVRQHLAAAIAGIVQHSSIRQTAKNALTAGVLKSGVYASQKIFKMLRSLR